MDARVKPAHDASMSVKRSALMHSSRVRRLFPVAKAATINGQPWR